ncbi:MAG: DUF4296 domain-containing protein [Bacteroidales bacterium]|nr:DUF4296 domain-containing protein [Bacteroidales bacterium]
MFKTFLKIFVFVFFTLNISCNNEDEVKHSSDIMSKKEFISILIDINKTDALLTKESLFDNKLSHPDSLSYYNQVFKKHGVTREIFYNTLHHYLNDINKFLEIQKIVVDSITLKYNYLDSIERLSLQNNDLWALKRNWAFPDDGVTNSIPFEIKMQNQGTYTLSARIMSYPDDLSKDLKMKINANYSDGTFDQKEVKILLKNAQWLDYTAVIQTNINKKLESVDGEVTSHSESTTYMHVLVQEIMLTYEPFEDAMKQDSTIVDSIQEPPK